MYDKGLKKTLQNIKHPSITEYIYIKFWAKIKLVFVLSKEKYLQKIKNIGY
jgi:hypothetical protein